MSLILGSSEDKAFVLPRRAAPILLFLLCAGCGASAPRTGAGSVSSPKGPESLVIEPVKPNTSGGVVTVQNVGSFQLHEEKDTSSVPVMHMPSRWTKLRLVFTTLDQGAYALLEDTGEAVTIDVQVPTCLTGSRYYQYAGTEDESHLYEAMYNVLRSALRICPRRISKADEYVRQFRLARADFPTAIRAMKARAVVVFGGIRNRCRETTIDSDNPFRPCP